MLNVRSRNLGHPVGLFGLRSPFVAVALAGALAACGKSSPSSSNPKDQNPPPSVTLQAISVDPPAASIGKGLGVHFTATGHYSDDSTAIMPFVTWSSSDALVAQVDAELGLADCMKPGPVTITATATVTENGVARQVRGTATLTVTDATLQSVEIVPSEATVVKGAFPKAFTLIGRYSDGTGGPLSNVSWSASDSSLVDVSAVGVTGVVTGKAVGALTVTGRDTRSGLSASATVTVELPPTPVDVAASNTSQLNSTGLFFGHVTGLTPGTEYLIRISSADPSFTVEAEKDASFASSICSTWSAGPACYVGALAPTATELFYMVKGPGLVTYTVDVFPIPSAFPGAPATVRTEDYYKIAVAGSTFTITMDGLSDNAADVFVYSSAQPTGDFGSNLLCSTATSLPLPTKSCTGPVPLGATNIYVTVEGWLTGTAGPLAASPGSTYTLSL